jgi:hypothetical protein
MLLEALYCRSYETRDLRHELLICKGTGGGWRFTPLEIHSKRIGYMISENTWSLEFQSTF